MKLTITLDEESAVAVQAAVDTGAYGSREQVVEDAVRDWVTTREMDGVEPASGHLARAYREGLASLEAHGSVLFTRQDAERIIREARENRAQRPAAE